VPIHCGTQDDLLETIIPFFTKHPLRTSKQQDFEAFSRCMKIVATGRHLTREGLVEVAEIAQTMNHQKPRHELIRILRDHTPEALDKGHEMVPSAWRHAGNGIQRKCCSVQADVRRGHVRIRQERNSLSGKRIARAGGNSSDQPANNGEALLVCEASRTS
jgi:hypothetical protein